MPGTGHWVPGIELSEFHWLFGVRHGSEPYWCHAPLQGKLGVRIGAMHLRIADLRVALHGLFGMRHGSARCQCAGGCVATAGIVVTDGRMGVSDSIW